MFYNRLSTFIFIKTKENGVMLGREMEKEG